MKGAVGAILLQLQEKVGFPYTIIPIDAYRYGSAGIASWATICGTVNGAAAAMNYVLPASDIAPVVGELLGWYSETSLPTTACDPFAKFKNQVASVSGNPLCHTSVSKWCAASGFKESSPERKDRCAKLTGDVAAKAIELLNAYFAKQFTPGYKVSAETAACQSCHVGKESTLENSLTNMDCKPCHGDPHK